jgi:hypothetical protein
MGIVYAVLANFVDEIEDVEEIAFGIDAGAIDAGEDLADDFLAGGGVELGVEGFEVGQKFAVDEVIEAVHCAILEFFTFPALGESVAGEEDVIAVGGCPVVPAEGDWRE